MQKAFRAIDSRGGGSRGGELWVLLLLFAVSGCASVRAQVGYGFGAGADVKIPLLLHTGLGFGFWKHIGPDYGRAADGKEPAREEDGDYWDITVTYPFKVAHHESCRRQRNHGFPEDPLDQDRPENHDCKMFLPVSLFTDGYTYHHYALEIGLMLGVVDLRLGFNPWFLANHKQGTEPDFYRLDLDRTE